ncbi:hypothetical protein IRP63_09535 [Clostridium botulinum]|uniref:Uncharacterized protein n=1 Tax=Clostridium botulinum C/D str. DC5 TaxID=1443128 RepID=A0A0A0IJ27_CLOBO|nr:hypothetical protein [Clostridium botulinum]KEI04626.1 hypothetical protein Z952_06575 [Clostridium botulinum C/D str. BKT75002]KEI06079.1 hypothetical protein Z954_05560 [Clostridium botulinum C/D str. BKT2873]KGM93715.1 hypothetical protein Z956_10350 [Clostridium botulinum D str. CCUG 7971]KGN01480.1 hypothetical protein Z955_01160 [Clostridium botulinum C/D str. DC5]KOC49799.1 hypothetical protein ADU88_04920 [Clostridium botulinum]
MVPFKRVWEDAIRMVSKDEIKDINIVETYKGGFVVEENKDTEFINKDDFVYFWSKMICNNEVLKEEVSSGRKLKYVYEIVKNLPYISENANGLKLVD